MAPHGLKLLIPTLDYPPIEGGLSTLTLETARSLAAMGHGVTVLAPFFPDTHDFDAAEPYRVVRWHGYEFGLARWFPFMQQGILWCDGPDLLLAVNHLYGGMLGRRARQRFGTPYVTFAYAYEFLKYGRLPGIHRTLHHIYNEAEHVIAISAFTRHALIDFGIRPTQVTVAYPGVRSVPPPHEMVWQRVRDELNLGQRVYILAAGRLIPRKGFRTLVDAFAILRRQALDAVLVIVGRGPEERAIRSRAAMNRVLPHVRMTGYLPGDDLAALYEHCAIFALATREEAGGQVEGLGLVFLEAASFGKASIAGKGGGVDEVIADGETGYLVDGRDAQALASAMTRLLTNADLRARMGEAAKARAATFTWERFARETLEAAGFDG